ncbi:MAG: thioredoxin family protein [Ignavibacteriaceae bacterium]
MYKDLLRIDEFNEFIKTNSAALIYFSTPGCNVCKVLKPKTLNFINENFPLIKLAYVDCEKSKELAAQNSIFTVPVIIIYFEGKEFVRKTRNFNFSDLYEEVNRAYSLLFSA